MLRNPVVVCSRSAFNNSNNRDYSFIRAQIFAELPSNIRTRQPSNNTCVHLEITAPNYNEGSREENLSEYITDHELLAPYIFPNLIPNTLNPNHIGVIYCLFVCVGNYKSCLFFARPIGRKLNLIYFELNFEYLS